MSSYGVALESISITKFRHLLQNTELLPSQKALKENMDSIFDVLMNNSIKDLGQLQSLLKTKSALQAFAVKTGLNEDILTVLRREINSYNPQKRKIGEFPDVDPRFIDKLAAAGIVNTQQFFDRVFSADGRTGLAGELGTGMEPVLELTKMVDVTRLRYVNQSWAALLVRAGYDSLEKVSRAEPGALYQEIVKVNEERGYYKGVIRMKDLMYLINDAREVPRQPVEY